MPCSLDQIKSQGRHFICIFRSFYCSASENANQWWGREPRSPTEMTSQPQKGGGKEKIWELHFFSPSLITCWCYTCSWSYVSAVSKCVFARLAPAAPSQGYSVTLSWVSIHLKPVLYICWSPRCLLGPKGWAWQVLVPILSPNLRAAAAEGMQPLHGHEHQHVPNCSLGCSAANWPNKNDQIEISTFLKTGSLQTAGKWRWKTSQGKPKLTSVF